MASNNSNSNSNSNGNTSSAVVIKALYEPASELRRVQLASAPSSFADLHAALSRVFTSLSTLSVAYTDEDGDKITVSTDAEVAALFAQGQHCVRLIVNGGVAASPEHHRHHWRNKLASLSPEEQAQRRQRWQAKFASLSPEEQEQRRQRWQAKFASLSPEEQEQRRQRKHGNHRWHNEHAALSPEEQAQRQAKRDAFLATVLSPELLDEFKRARQAHRERVTSLASSSSAPSIEQQEQQLRSQWHAQRKAFFQKHLAAEQLDQLRAHRQGLRRGGHCTKKTEPAQDQPGDCHGRHHWFKHLSLEEQDQKRQEWKQRRHNSVRHGPSFSSSSAAPVFGPSFGPVLFPTSPATAAPQPSSFGFGVGPVPFGAPQHFGGFGFGGPMPMMPHHHHYYHHHHHHHRQQQSSGGPFQHHNHQHRRQQRWQAFAALSPEDQAKKTEKCRKRWEDFATLSPEEKAAKIQQWRAEFKGKGHGCNVNRHCQQQQQPQQC